MATILGVDTSNYATSLALVSSAGEVVCAKKRMLPVKEGELGLRQSDALFHHTVALPQLLAELQNEAPLADIQAVGVSVRPRPVEGSYMPCFLAGQSFASAFSAAAGVRLCHKSHQEGHIAAALYATKRPELFAADCLVFHISGGTTDMLLCQGTKPLATLGTSLDLYAGQAVDRLGVRLGFLFPAGPDVSRLALECDEEIKPKISLKGMDCHLSGLQNQCEKLLSEGNPAAYVAKYCLSALADTVVGMLRAGLREYPGLPVVCAGGVMSSETIRDRVQAAFSQAMFVPGQFSSDNAIGTAILAAREVGVWQM